MFKLASRSLLVCRRSISSCPAGTSLNLKVKRGPKDPVALADEEYPAWLWKILDREHLTKELAADPIKQARKMLRKRTVEKIKASNFVSKMS